MDNIVFLILRRMRYPLVVLIVVYAVSILGLIMIPGEDAQGNVWHMSIFHAFYFVSYMSTTIGFGELPYAFNDAQRLWVTLSLYFSVIAWLYAIGTILSLLKDKVFRQAIVERRFARRVRRLREPFVLVCGYGETGSTLVKALTDRGRHAVVVDADADRINLIKLQNLRDNVPSLVADASRPRYLLEAGLAHTCCTAVVAVVDRNETNLKIAITSKLLHADVKVICRADSRDVEANMESFGTDVIVDPYEIFGLYFSIAFQSPCLYLLKCWLVGEEHSRLSQPIYPPTRGHWIICGYGRFGKALYSRLQKEKEEGGCDLSITVIEACPEQTGEPPDGVVRGRGTEAETLREAGIERARGLIAGTDDDVNNLSIIMTARSINKDLFVVVRQNRRENDPIIAAVKADMVMHPSAIIAERIRVALATPMLYDFLWLSVGYDDQWACQLVSRISGIVPEAQKSILSEETPDEQGTLKVLMMTFLRAMLLRAPKPAKKNPVHFNTPVVQELTLTRREAPAVTRVLQAGKNIRLYDLLRDPLDRNRRLPGILLMLERNGEKRVLPDGQTLLRPGDKLLFCGRRSVFSRMAWSMSYDRTLDYVLHGDTHLVYPPGQERSGGWLWWKLRSLLNPDEKS